MVAPAADPCWQGSERHSRLSAALLIADPRPALERLRRAAEGALPLGPEPP